MSAQLRILRVFRWVAIFTIFVALNTAGLDIYREWERESPKIEIRQFVWICELHFISVLLAALVWITSSMAEKYLAPTEPNGGLAKDRRE